MLAAAALLTQPLQYAGIDISVGRPELVCSSPQVRQRGYIREIMQLLHHKSSARGDLMQAITGIPNYYHQFGYVWSVDYNAFRTVRLADIPTTHETELIVRHQYFIATLIALKTYVSTLPKAHVTFPETSKLYIQVDAQPAWEALFHTFRIHTATEAPYTWYIRVPEFAAFLWHIRSALEARMAASAFRGYTGALIIWFYGTGVEMTWRDGTLQSVTPWRAPAYGEPFHATYPPGIFAQQVFGWRSFRELHTWRKDVWAQAECIPMLETLFPTQSSWFLWSN